MIDYDKPEFDPLDTDKRENVYTFCLDYFDERSGLWIVRNSWSYLIARVVQFEPLIGSRPFFNNGNFKNRPKVYADLYRPDGYLVEGTAEISSPSTFAYKRIAAPVWA